jgi:CelD/BcsL family acetyltransferase involved in cellulose biosynthesis
MKNAWLRQRGLFSLALQDPGFDRFFMDVALGEAHPADTRISAVRCNGTPIAVEISFACKGHVFGHVIAYEAAFAKQGIGVVLAEYSIRTAHEQGHARFDLLAPADAYKLDWADACVEVDDWAMPQSLAGKLYARAWLGMGRPWLKTAAKAMPVGVSRALSMISRRARLPAKGSSSRD